MWKLDSCNKCQNIAGRIYIFERTSTISCRGSQGLIGVTFFSDLEQEGIAYHAVTFHILHVTRVVFVMLALLGILCKQIVVLATAKQHRNRIDTAICTSSPSEMSSFEFT